MMSSFTQIAPLFQANFLFINGVLKSPKSSHEDDFTWCHYENFGQGQKKVCV